MAGASRELEMNARADVIFRVVTDYEAYPEFIDEIVDAEILARSDQSVECRFTAEVAKKRFSYTLRLDHTPPTRTRWQLIAGDFKKNNGGWDFKPLGDGGRTHVTYSLEIDLGMFIPQFIINSLVGANMPKMLEAVKKRAEDAERQA